MNRPLERADGRTQLINDAYTLMTARCGRCSRHSRSYEAARCVQARLVATPQAPKEVLLSDDPPPSRVGRFASHAAATDDARSYPEWNWRTATYRDPGALVRSFIAPGGSRKWVERSLATHRATL